MVDRSVRTSRPASWGTSTYLTAAVPARLAQAGTSVALPLLAIQEVGDIAVGGALVAVVLAPSVIVAPFVGAMLDRSAAPARLITAAAFITALAYAAGAFLGATPLPLTFLALAISGCLSPFLMGGLSSVVADIIPDERRAYGQDALAYNIAGVGGPGLVAVLSTVTSARVAMLTLAVMALVGALGAAAIRLRRSRSSGAVGGVMSSIGVGIRYLIGHRPLAVVTASGTLSQLGAGAFPIAALALALERSGGSEAGAWLVTSFSIGALSGSILAAFVRARRASPQAVMFWGFLITGLAIIAAVPTAGIAAAIGAVAAAGFASAPGTAAMLLIRKQQSPEQVRAQVFTVGAGLRSTAAAIGAALVGLMGVPAGVLFTIIGSIWVVSAALLLAFPRGAEPLTFDPSDRAHRA